MLSIIAYVILIWLAALGLATLVSISILAKEYIAFRKSGNAEEYDTINNVLSRFYVFLAIRFLDISDKLEIKKESNENIRNHR